MNTLDKLLFIMLCLPVSLALAEPSDKTSGQPAWREEFNSMP